MLKIFSAHEVDAMRRDAKKRARKSGVILAEALDETAMEHGYRNWGLLRKNGSISRDEPQPWRFQRTPDEIAQSMRVVPDPASWRESRTRSDIARDSVQSLDGKFASTFNAVDFATTYVEGILAQPRFRLDTKSVAYWEMRFWLPYGAAHVDGELHILVNRYYKPVGTTSREFVDYAKYSRLSLPLSGEGWRGFAYPTARQPFLYNDGCVPWDSRTNAKAYLARLKELRGRLLQR